MKKFHQKHINKKNNFLLAFSTIAILCICLLALVSLHQVNSTLFGKKGGANQVNVQGQTITGTTAESITVLLAGRGGFGNDAPELTDTLIVAKLNKSTKEVSLLSIPRDLYVKYKKINGARRMSKINAIYANNLNGKGSEWDSMEQVVKKIEEITGENIDYYVNVDFNGFTQIVDALGGIEIDVPRRLVDNQYPTNNWGWETVIFKKGLQTMTGEQALKYARSRKSTSDYDRSIRQQLVIQAIKDKISSRFLLDSPEKIGELYGVFDKNLFTNMSITDAISIVLGIDVFKADFKFYSSNMHEGCFPGDKQCEKGGILYPPSLETFGGQAVSLFDDATPANIGVYKLSKKYSDIALNYPKISAEDYKINVINATNYRGITYKLFHKIKRYGFNINYNNFAKPSPEIYEKSIIYYSGIDKDSQTIKALSLFFDGELQEVVEPQFAEKENIQESDTNNPVSKKTTTGTIEIVLGSDYIKNEKIFTF